VKGRLLGCRVLPLGAGYAAPLPAWRFFVGASQFLGSITAVPAAGIFTVGCRDPSSRLRLVPKRHLAETKTCWSKNRSVNGLEKTAESTNRCPGAMGSSHWSLNS